MVWRLVVACADGGEGGAAFGESAGAGSKLKGEGFADAGALGEAF